MMHELSEQELLRRESLHQLRLLGIEPYPAETFEVNASAREILENYENNKIEYKNVSLAGRIMTRRIMGNAAFAVLQDSTGKIQVYVKRDEICPGEDKTLYNTVFKKLLDIGDIIGVKGYVFTTQTGETTLHVTELNVLSKALRPLPVVKEKDGEVFDAVSDPELRYRQRYVDLIINPEVRETFRKRTQLMNTMREYLNEKGYLEVETPILQPLYGGAAARPFKTHHNTLDMTLYLRIANELYLKRLIVGGYDGVYEFSKDFRNEGMSRFHNPEFTQIELYVAYKDYYWMMNLVEEMVEKVALALHGTTDVKVGEHTINFQRPWKRFTMYEAIKEYTGVDISEMDEQTMFAEARKMHVPLDASMGRGKIIDAIFGEKVEPFLIHRLVHRRQFAALPARVKHRPSAHCRVCPAANHKVEGCKQDDSRDTLPGRQSVRDRIGTGGGNGRSPNRAGHDVAGYLGRNARSKRGCAARHLPFSPAGH